MNKNYTLKELADMFASVRREALSNGQSIEGARELALKHILDAIGYEFPVDAEREAFAKWWATSNLQTFCNAEDAFKAWKAGREELRKEVCSDKCEETKTEPAWIPWHGGDKSPIIGQQTKFEIKYRDGIMEIYNQRQNLPLDWENRGCHYDIVAYRILD